jgi:hypothetical protein
VIRLGIRLHGIRFPFVVVNRCWRLVSLRCFGAKTFEYAGRRFDYCFHHYSLDNERVVEVSLARDFLKGINGEILEVGNVLSHYFDFPHDVVDKYEVAPGVMNEDIVDYVPGKKYAGIILVSTLEHIGWDEQPRDPKKIGQAILHLKSLLAPGGRMFVTMPLGYNPNVDEMLRNGATGFSETGYLLRISADNRWREAKQEEVRDAKFAAPFPCANAVFIGTFQQPR